MVSKYFSPDDYFDSGNLLYRQATSLLSSMAKDPANNISTIFAGIRKVDLSVWEGSWLQLSSFPQLFTPTSFTFYKPIMNQQLGEFPLPQRYVEEYGLFQLQIT